MRKKVFYVLLVSTLVFCWSCSRKEAKEPASTRDVNVLLLTLDTTRPDYLSCYGSKTVKTPNIDALAGRGVRFTQAVAQVPLTLPSHACILTGAYPQVHQIRDNGGFRLDSGVPTLATIASSAGWKTGAFVGAAILNRTFGLQRGFDIYSDEMKEEKQSKKLPGIMAELRAEVVTQRALNWLDAGLKQGVGNTPGKRFVAWLHYYDPHFPYDPPEPFAAQYRKDPYGGEIAYIDAQVGRVLGWIKARQLGDSTLVILIGDHGESLGEHGEYTHGVFLYDSTMHVPFIVAGPGIPAGRTASQQVRSIDVLPTIAEYLGLSTGGRAQGVSLLPLMTAGHAVRNTYSYMETLYPKTAMGWSELRGVRAGEWKYISAPKAELYELTQDPKESANVLARHPEEASRLEKRVWEVAGDLKSGGALEPSPLDDQTRRELESLGYLNVNRKREIRIDMSGPDPKDRVEILQIMEKTGEMVNHDQYRPAIPLLQKAIKEDPTNPMAYTRLGLCYERTGQYVKTVEVYRAAIKNKADSDTTYAELGEIYVRLGKLDLAGPAMEHAAELNPANLQNLTNLATAYLQSGRPADAERVLRGVLAQKPNYAEAHNVLGVLEVSRGRGDAARVHFEKAIESQPDDPDAYLNLGLLAEKSGQLSKAASCYEQFLAKASPEKHKQVIPEVRAALARLKTRGRQ